MTREKQLEQIALSLLQMIADKIGWYKTKDDEEYLKDIDEIIRGTYGKKENTLL